MPLQNVVLQPLQNAKAVNTYDVFIHASGGGMMGQAGAAQLAIARALLQVDVARTVLRQAEPAPEEATGARIRTGQAEAEPQALDGWGGSADRIAAGR